MNGEPYSHHQKQTPLEAANARITELEALCLNALYNHQGASSAVGQPIRKALGIGEHDRLTEERLKIIQSVRTL